MIRIHSPRGVVRLIAEVFEAGRSTAAAMEASHRIKDGVTVYHRGWTFDLSGSH